MEEAKHRGSGQLVWLRLHCCVQARSARGRGSKRRRVDVAARLRLVIDQTLRSCPVFSQTSQDRTTTTAVFHSHISYGYLANASSRPDHWDETSMPYNTYLEKTRRNFGPGSGQMILRECRRPRRRLRPMHRRRQPDRVRQASTFGGIAWRGSLENLPAGRKDKK